MHSSAQVATFDRVSPNAAVKIFLSHHNKDHAVVKRVLDDLLQKGFTAWWFETEIPFGQPISAEVEKHIRECDFFVLFHSRTSIKSPYVQSELDLALSLTGEESCEIRIYQVDDEPLSVSLRLRDWKTGLEKSATYDCTTPRCFNPAAPHQDSYKNWLGGFEAQVRYYGYGGLGSDELPDSFFQVYESLFPDDDQRAPPDDTRFWIDESRNEPNLEYRDLIASLEIAGKVVSFIYVTPYMTSGLVFGSYFGVLRKHRSKNYARILYENTKQHLNGMYDTACREAASLGRNVNWTARPHGYIFEVDPISLSQVEALVAKLEGLGRAPEPSDLFQGKRGIWPWRNEIDEPGLIRAAKRIHLYERNKCRAILNARREPMPYIQPALEEPLTSDKEEPLVLMYCPINTSAEAFERMFPYQDVISGLYLDWYTDANAKGNMVGIPGYGRYLEGLFRRVRNKAEERFTLGSLLSRPVKRLLELDRRYKLSGPL
jgi:hypothetical protein